MYAPFGNGWHGVLWRDGYHHGRNIPLRIRYERGDCRNGVIYLCNYRIACRHPNDGRDI